MMHTKTTVREISNAWHLWSAQRSTQTVICLSEIWRHLPSPSIQFPDTVLVCPSIPGAELKILSNSTDFLVKTQNQFSCHPHLCDLSDTFTTVNHLVLEMMSSRAFHDPILSWFPYLSNTLFNMSFGGSWSSSTLPFSMGSVPISSHTAPHLWKMPCTNTKECFCRLSEDLPIYSGPMSIYLNQNLSLSDNFSWMSYSHFL